MDQNESPPGTASFQMWWWYRWWVVIGFAVVLGFGIPFVGRAFSGGAPWQGVVFAAVWFGGVSGYGYLGLTRICFRIVVENGALHWYAPVRSGWVSLAEISGTRVVRIQSSRRRPAYLEFIRCSGGRRSVLFLVTSWNRENAVDFLVDLHHCLPNSSISLG